MCGRYALWGIDLLGKRFLVVDPMIGYRSHFNIAPGTQNPVITASRMGNHFSMMTWGLVPPWTPAITKGNKLINARAESLADRVPFKHLLGNNRCIVPANGFFEWKKTPTHKDPYFICKKDRSLFGFAGLFSTSTGPQGPLQTYTIITTSPNDVVAPYHNRMPVILQEGSETAWLSQFPLNTEDLARILSPFPADMMAAYPVSSRVNSTNEDGEDLIASVSVQSTL